MMQILVSSWRKVWSATPGTTDPEAPFGIASLADGTDEGFGVNMRGFRWAQTGGYGVLPNPQMPATFLADAFDLGDPWHTPLCGNDGSFEGGDYVGEHCCVATGAALGPLCKAGHHGQWSLNATRDWAGLGTLHPRMKKPLGKRLAQGLHATAYNGAMPVSGPVIAGCQVSADARSLVLEFNGTLLKGDGVVFNTSNTVAKEDTALYVLVNDTAFGPEWIAAVTSNHEQPACRGGSCPDQMHGRYLGPYSDGNEMGLSGWIAVAAKHGAPSSANRASNQLVIDLSSVPAGKSISAIRYASGSGGYNSTTGEYLVRKLGSSRLCCGPTVDPAFEPCGPERCPIMSIGQAGKSLPLPATPYFARITSAGSCKCFAPQQCG